VSRRLSRDALREVSAAVRTDIPAGLDTGIVHVGLGAFHRAHQAVYTQDAITATGDTRWGITAVAPRSPQPVATLRAQGGVYSVLSRSGSEAQLRVIGVHQDGLHVPTQTETVLTRLAAPGTQVITLTVTEKAYRIDAGTGGLARDPHLDAELAGAPPRSVVGLLVRGLQQRLGHRAPVTVVCCDNLRANGSVLHRLVGDFIDRLPAAQRDPLTAYLDSSVRFPQTMVDRIVPAPTHRDRDEVEQRLGLRDDLAVGTEPFSQWVLQDHFAADRPAWHLAGATFTDDVAGYETVKLRLLNGTHSALAYFGLLAGHSTIAASAADPLLLAAARTLITRELTPTLTPPAGLDLTTYGDSVLTRFANPALHHPTRQVAMDGSHKLPHRLLEPLRHHLARGRLPRLTTLVIAAWVYLVLSDDPRTTIEDPLAATIRTRAAGRLTPPRLPELFGADLDADPAFQALLTDQLQALHRHGLCDTLRTDVSCDNVND
jgi:fructuronate reductase